MLHLNKIHCALVVCFLAAPLCLTARAAERVTLRSGSQFDCMHREIEGDRVRLYLVPSAHARNVSQSSDYVEVASNAVLSVEPIPDPVVMESTPATARLTAAATARLTPAEMTQMLAHAGATHNIDADLLASLIKAESNGNTLAVSRTGAQGLMQLMPATASSLGVHNSFAPGQNIGGGTAYLDGLLTRYHDNIALALAAYNAGPLAVDRYHGIPPYRETRTYVARVIREFNRRKLAAANGVTP